MEMGKATYRPTVKYRVLATYWEAESFVECWTEHKEAAATIARLLKANESAGDCSVQIDEVVGTAPPRSHSAS